MNTATPMAAAVPPSEQDPGALLARMKDASRRQPVPDHDRRLRALERLESALLSRKEALAAAISTDFGHRSTHESLAGEVFVVLGAIRHAKAHLRDWMEPEEREVSWLFATSSAQVLPQPLGVVGIISPWNYPVLLALSPLVSVLAAGNRALLKPSELVPTTSAALRDLIAEAFAEDEVAVVTGGPEVGERFSRLPFDHLVFTGSTRVGKLVMKAASENLVPVTLELGGKSPAILGAESALPSAATRVMCGKLWSAGQTCIAPDYVLAPAALVEPFALACKAAAGALYPTFENNPDYTSILADAHRARLQRLLDDARDRGARVLPLHPPTETFDGSRKFPPAIVLGMTEDMAIAREEIFGPILPIVPYRDLSDAIAYVNDRPRPLALYYFGHDRRAIDRVLSETIAGGVTINETLLHLMQDDLPFGGIGPSGMGHYHGREGFEAFTKKKPVFQQSRLSTRGILRPPFGKVADLVLRALLR